MALYHFSLVGDTCRAIADFLFPPLCYSCGTLLPSAHRIICPTCAATLTHVDRNDPVFGLARDRLCADGAVDDLFSLYKFEKGKELQALLHELKYAGAADVGRWLGVRLGRALRESGAVAGIDAIIPVPLHVVKKRERGFNQCEHIARGVREILELPARPELVRRCRHTSTQTQLGIDERMINMEGAFAVPLHRRKAIERRGFLLLDDVITTGATVRACAGALRAAGARTIVACSVALADRTTL